MSLEDQVKGAKDQVSGKAKEVMGSVTGDKQTEAEGIDGQGQGSVQ